MWSAVFSSLAGSLFVIRLIDVRSSTPVALAGTLGVNIASLNSRATFVAAAGVRVSVEPVLHLKPPN